MLFHPIIFFRSVKGDYVFIVCLTPMQMLTHWNVPQTGADGHDKPRPFTLSEHDITTYGCSDGSVVGE